MLERWNPGEYQERGRIRASAEKVEIWASTGKGSIQVSSRKVEIRVSIGKVDPGRVPERWDPKEY